LFQQRFVRGEPCGQEKSSAAGAAPPSSISVSYRWHAARKKHVRVTEANYINTSVMMQLRSEIKDTSVPRFSQHDFTVEGMSALILHRTDSARTCAGSLGFSRPGSAGSP
jgi:hypothetical protein